MNFLIVIIKHKIIYTILGFLFFGIFYLTLSLDFQYRAFTCLFLLFLMVLFFVLSYKNIKVVIIGKIEITDKLILIYDLKNQISNKLILNNVDEFILKYSAFKGELPSGARQFVLSKGGDNKIKIKIKNDIYKYNIYLENQPDAIRFKMLYRFLKENNIHAKFIEF